MIVGPQMNKSSDWQHKVALTSRRDYGIIALDIALFATADSNGNWQLTSHLGSPLVGEVYDPRLITISFPFALGICARRPP